MEYTMYYDSMIGAFVVERNHVRYAICDNAQDAIAALKGLQNG